MEKNELLKQKAEKGQLCLNWMCEQREHCLRWQPQEYAPKDRLLLTSVNPRHRDVAKGRCPLYLADEKVMLAKGMVQFYDEMPRKVEERIKGLLIATYGRTIYYEYRNGKRLIPPKMQAYIREVCQHCGWTKEPQYDGFVEDYAWE